MVAGPPGTVVVGYANGHVGLWSVDNGSLLHSARLHGPVVHLRVVGGQLVAVSSLGDNLSWELTPMTIDRCELLRQIWEQVPAVWTGGLPVEQSPPPDHACAAP